MDFLRSFFRHGSLAIYALTSLILFASPSALANELNFSQAWQLLLQNNNGLAASRANKNESVYLQEAAKDLYFPKIDIKAGYSRLNDDITLAPSQVLGSMPAGDAIINFLNGLPDFGNLTPAQINDGLTSEIASKDVVTASLSAIWPIYAGGRINAAQDIAAGQFMEADYLLRIKKQALFEQLSKVYFGVVLSQQILQTRRDAEQGLFKHLSHAKKLEEQGQIAKVERLKAQASHEKARVEMRKAQRNLEIAQLALSRLLQIEQDTSPSSKLFINEKMPLLADINSAMLKNHPGLGVLKAKRKQVQGLIEVKEGEYWPEAFLFANYNLYEQDTLAAELAPDWVVGVGLSVPITSRNGRSGKLSAAKSTLLKIGYLKAQAIRDLSLLVDKTWREAQIAREEYNGLEISLELAHENIRMREEAFAQGLSTSLEVVDAELFLMGVKTQRQVAAYQYVLSLARLLALSDKMAQFSDYQLQGKPIINKLNNQMNDQETL